MKTVAPEARAPVISCPETGAVLSGEGVRTPYTGIFHITNHYACNLACPYCIAGGKSRKRRFNLAALRAILERIQAISRPVSLLLAQWGEFFTSSALMEETTRLCNEPGNLVGVSIATNLHADWDRVIRPFAEGLDTDRLSMACTLHEGVIGEKAVGYFFDKVSRLHEMGVLVYVNYVIHDEEAIAKAGFHKELCDSLAVPFTIFPSIPMTLLPDGRKAPDIIGGLTSWSAEALRALEPLCDSLHAYRMLFDARSPSGMPCGAGRDYFYIDPTGEIFPCFTNSRPASSMGHILRDGLAPLERDMVCREQFCYCPYDIPAMRIVEGRYVRTRDMRLILPRDGICRCELEQGYGMPLRLLREMPRVVTEKAPLMKG